MLFHRNPLFSIYFGNAADELYQQEYLQIVGYDAHELIQHPSFAHMSKMMGLTSLLFLKQVHGTQGLVITEENCNSFVPFSLDGDYLLTDQSDVGIGVMTADCLPIVFYDMRHHAVAIVHAGWRGSVAGIATKALCQMQEQYDTDVQQIRIFFGPSAKACCYEVTQDFLEQFSEFSFAGSLFMHRAGKIFFDLSEYNKQLLQEYGVAPHMIQLGYNICTMCATDFFSHRIQAQQGAQRAGRQMTVVSLK
ncbi:MAG TPA: peptidoglycan editing factor PgeF [Candidatus Babeliales bacterium]|nr:peptidoglycan editing factor PgeF [Candidatus Babeliales bacterium]